jgi:hypothetical protein
MNGNAESLILKLFPSANRLSKYDGAWDSYLPGIEELVGQGASLATLVTHYANYLSRYQGFLPEFLGGKIKVDLGAFADLPPEPLRLAVVEGKYVAVERIPRDFPIVDVVSQLIDDEVDCVVELGSGLGFNLAALRLRMPHKQFTYVAMEPSESGRKATRMIFSTDPAAAVETHPFDYHQPDFSPLARFKRIIAFTSHSIEQIPLLGAGFYDQLLALPVMACAHAEPVGWQRFSNIVANMNRLLADEVAWHTIVPAHCYRFTDEHLAENSAIWAVSAGYNTDLLPIIAAAADAGKLDIRLLSYDVFGANPVNPSTLIAWKR